ncbi:MAG: hypothetical protein Q8R13_04350 [bacterium]|nr:hypothetical protein [bacterium]MDZ4296623.1 hypothetical protein [Patescibacteria group bacterium]
MYLYSGIDIIRHPSAWYWALRPLPTAVYSFITTQIGIDRYLMLQAGGEFVIGIVLLAWFMPRGVVLIAALATTVEMAAILFFVGVDAITFRDLGLLGGAATLVLLIRQQPGAAAKDT